MILTLQAEDAIELTHGTLTRSAEDISLRSAEGTTTIRDSNLTAHDDLVVGVFTEWLVLLGERSKSLLAWDVDRPTLSVVGVVPRLELSGYDPGGLNRVALIPIDDNSCIVETEVSLSLVRRDQGIKWSFVHDDLTLKLEAVANGMIEVTSEYGGTRLSLEDGSYRGAVGYPELDLP